MGSSARHYGDHIDDVNTGGKEARIHIKSHTGFRMITGVKHTFAVTTLPQQPSPNQTFPAGRGLHDQLSLNHENRRLSDAHAFKSPVNVRFLQLLLGLFDVLCNRFQHVHLRAAALEYSIHFKGYHDQSGRETSTPQDSHVHRDI
eukprot:GHVU01225916.1.p1 GENE.GHVU01225916.1~~GHVU01225916.1.p1  ORF type:complete len:145 (+),score=4.32 GHVU01225916.1:1547-1981(+)